MLLLAGKNPQSTLACSVVKVPKRRDAAPGADAEASRRMREPLSEGDAVHAAGARLEACVRMCVRVRSGHSASAGEEWWSRGDSNPLPPPCKGGALPGELRPRGPTCRGSLGVLSAGSLSAPRTMSMDRWWAILDSNQGPQSYQDCALTT